MRVRSQATFLFRDALYQRDFIEIQTPKLVAGCSEGSGADVFRLAAYFDQPEGACLAQSPQLYKQLAYVQTDRHACIHTDRA